MKVFSRKELMEKREKRSGLHLKRAWELPGEGSRDRVNGPATRKSQPRHRNARQDRHPVIGLVRRKGKRAPSAFLAGQSTKVVPVNAPLLFNWRALTLEPKTEAQRIEFVLRSVALARSRNHANANAFGISENVAVVLRWKTKRNNGWPGNAECGMKCAHSISIKRPYNIGKGDGGAEAKRTFHRVDSPFFTRRSRDGLTVVEYRTP